MVAFRSITPAQCPLVRDLPGLPAASLVEQFNDALRKTEAVENSDIGGMMQRPEIQKLLVQLERIHATLTRPRYLVGFLGTSSAGKSTIFNRVLQREIARGGAGDATTSLPSRLYGSSSIDLCRLVYLSQPEYLDRRLKLAQALGLGTPPTANRDFLTLLAQPLAQRVQDDPNARPFLEHDVAYLRSFLESYDAHGRAVVEPVSEVRDVPFDNRSQFINHMVGEHGGDQLLLREAELLIANTRIPTELEMCDLPGLNSKRSIDTIITTDFLNLLDGALLFVNVAENLFNATVSEILVRLKQHFGGSLEGRAWVIFNKCDTLTDNHYHPASGTASVFDNIRKFLSENGVPISQVCFTSSRVHSLVDPTTGRADPQRVADALFRPIAELVPNTCPAEMRPLYEELLKDGGVGRLRDLILTQVGNSVAVKIREQSERALREYVAELEQRVETERRRIKGGRNLTLQAQICRATLLPLREALGERPEQFPLLAELAEHLRAKLEQVVRQSPEYLQVLRKLSQEKLQYEFPTHARLLAETLDAELQNDVVEKLYSEIGQRFVNLPAIPISRFPGGVHEAWQAFNREDRSNHDWRGKAFPRFESDELFQRISESRGFVALSGEAYLELIDEKINTAVRQTIHLMRTQLRMRLRQLEDELQLLIQGSPSNAS